jgi:soluble lytic murein transglycosylase-like protein
MRRFTPRFTAKSRPLWTSVARGELTIDYSLAGRLKNTLGQTLPVAGHAALSPAQLRVGAFATVGLGRAQAIVDRSLSASLGLVSQRVVVLAAPKRSDSGLRDDLTALFPKAHVRLVRPPHIDQAVISAYARGRIPATYLRLYRAAAATCRGLPWTVLAAIGTVETGNGTNTSTSSKGAMGPMQFLPSTFVAYAVDGDGDGVANIQDPADAIYSAARYLCAWGAGLGGQSLYAAIFAYNHADWYVREVIRLAIAYQ